MAALMETEATCRLVNESWSSNHREGQDVIKSIIDLGCHAPSSLVDRSP
jgi:hypothetical protein